MARCIWSLDRICPHAQTHRAVFFLLTVQSGCWIRYSRFQSVGSLTLHFPDNFGGDTTQIYYIGLRGEATQVLLAPSKIFPPLGSFQIWGWLIICVGLLLVQLKRDVVATIVYEVMPNPSDHKWVFSEEPLQFIKIGRLGGKQTYKWSLRPHQNEKISVWINELSVCHH